MLLALALLFAGGDHPDIEVVRQLSYRNNDNSVSLKRVKGTSALFFQSKMSCDVDGAPNAYHSLNDELALDVIGSAGGRRQGGLSSGPLEVQPLESVVAYKDGAPYIQPTGEFAGFYVSETSYENKSLPAIDSARYLDPRFIQYIVLPGSLAPEAHLGDLAVAYDPLTRKTAFAVFGDVGPSAESGEASLATLKRLGFQVNDGKSSPAEDRSDMLFLVFPNTFQELEQVERWPHKQATIDRLANRELRRWGGIRRLGQVAGTRPSRDQS